MTHRLALVASPDGLASGVAATLDLLMAANRLAMHYLGAQGPLFESVVVSVDGAAVRASNGYPIAVDGPLALGDDCEVVLVPGFTFAEGRQFRTNLAQAQPLTRWLRGRYEAGATLAASCTGSFLLAEAGLLDNRPATTTWWLARRFQQLYPHIELRQDELLVESERIVCGGAAMSQLDLTLYLIERLAGRQLARLCSKFMVLDGRRISQAPYVIPTHVGNADPLVAKAEAWMGKHLRQEIRIEELARELAVSPRTLIRRFQRATGLSPQAFLQKQRVDLARTLMETSDMRLTEILERVGYQDESAFRRLFKRHTGYSPGDYARRFGARRNLAA